MFAASKTDGSAVAPDAQFNYVTMLLHGDGTNGAQNNTFVDSSTNNFTITRNGNTTQGSFSPYGSGWSNVFDGSISSAYLSVATNTAFNCGTGNFTVEAWVNITAYTGSYPLIIGNNNGSFSAGAIALTSQNATSGGASKISFTAYDINSGGVTLAAASTNTIGGWTHFAVVRNGTSLVLYINGASSASTTISASVSLDFGKNGLLIGGGNWDTANGYYAGYISNLRLVKGTAVYTSAFTPSTTPLTAITNTSLLTCQSNRFKDNSANNFTITANSPSRVERFNPFGTATAYSTSVIGGSGYFDGSGDYLDFASGTAFNIGTGNFTIEFWANKTTNGSADYDGAFQVNSGGSYAWFVELSSTRGLLLGVNGVGSFACTTAVINDSAWHHWAICRSGSTWYMWRDGVALTPTTNSISNGSISANGTAYIGSAGGSFPFKGYMSDLRIVNGTALYTTAFTPPSAPLTAVTNTALLNKFQNAAIFDNAMMNDLETVGNAQISTSVKKYGTGSLAFDGTGDYLVSNVANSNLYAFGTGDFTIEGWYYFNSVTTEQELFDFRPLSTQGAYPMAYVWTDSKLYYWVSSANQITSSTTLSTGTWYHIAVCRSGTSTKMFINGTQTGSTYTDSTNYLVAANRPLLGVNAFQLNVFYNGNIDDFRITKGYARYTANFTPPTSALSDTGPV